MNRKIIRMEHAGATAKIFGSFDSNVRLIENHFSVIIRNRESESGDSIVIDGENAAQVDSAAQCIEYLHGLSSKTDVLTDQSVQYAIDMVSAGEGSSLAELGDECICVTHTNQTHTDVGKWGGQSAPTSFLGGNHGTIARIYLQKEA